MKIYAPVKDANGVYASVRFINGVGETDNPHLIDWFRKHGYYVPIEDSNLIIEDKNDQIENDDDQIENDEFGKDETSNEPDFESMTPLEIRDWAIAHGLGTKIKNTRNKEKLLEIVRG